MLAQPKTKKEYKKLVAEMLSSMDSESEDEKSSVSSIKTMDLANDTNSVLVLNVLPMAEVLHLLRILHSLCEQYHYPDEILMVRRARKGNGKASAKLVIMVDFYAYALYYANEMGKKRNGTDKNDMSLGLPISAHMSLPILSSHELTVIQLGGAYRLQLVRAYRF
ncbi:hypothetical protein Gogos_022414 [Gossypium gossypioides]|uniref:Uncharacterized protein n=1 Tax=Gossypium gossypioides TaxID=34282 RepID=A0A7J9D5K4_GOSGO|nr:hypothetical protein [Gossypium gossypioides]